MDDALGTFLAKVCALNPHSITHATDLDSRSIRSLHSVLAAVKLSSSYLVWQAGSFRSPYYAALQQIERLFSVTAKVVYMFGMRPELHQHITPMYVMDPARTVARFAKAGGGTISSKKWTDRKPMRPRALPRGIGQLTQVPMLSFLGSCVKKVTSENPFVWKLVRKNQHGCAHLGGKYHGLGKSMSAERMRRSV